MKKKPKFTNDNECLNKMYVMECNRVTKRIEAFNAHDNLKHTKWKKLDRKGHVLPDFFAYKILRTGKYKDTEIKLMAAKELVQEGAEWNTFENRRL